MPDTYTRTERMDIAATIVGQLGGNQFRMMTGAKHFLALDSGLQFQLPNARQANGVKSVRIVLDPSDTYTVTFHKPDGTLVRDALDNTYCDQLAGLFEDVTGLRTSLTS